VAALLAAARVVERRPPREGAWPFAFAEPEDLAALYAACDGLRTEDGAIVLGRGELRDATRWLVLDRALDWGEDLVVVGERLDSVVVLDLDLGGERAGGGVLEAPTDDLRALERVASDVVAWATLHACAGDDPAPPPEVLAARASDAEDAAALDAALARPWYPGHDAARSRAWARLGELRAREGAKERALAAFERSVEARVRTVPRGAEAREGQRAWSACALAARRAGDPELARLCEERGAAS
jgi:hypothetical protein